MYIAQVDTKILQYSRFPAEYNGIASGENTHVQQYKCIISSIYTQISKLSILGMMHTKIDTK